MLFFTRRPHANERPTVLLRLQNADQMYAEGLINSLYHTSFQLVCFCYERVNVRTLKFISVCFNPVKDCRCSALNVNVVFCCFRSDEC